ncbi:hypothetical protein [Hyphomonas sp.]|uniref:hypothetical protein n=1 Tax=Hyphomonas sp. TaxID=87 RepID=UPI001BCECF2D|nr:hypothetical protein [Hyphomonas sp.]
MPVALIALFPAVLMADAACAQSAEPMPQAEPDVPVTEEAGPEAEAEVLFSASCMTADTGFGGRIAQIKAASAGDAVGAIDTFTCAGNGRVPAAPPLCVRHGRWPC